MWTQEMKQAYAQELKAGVGLIVTLLTETFGVDPQAVLADIKATADFLAAQFAEYVKDPEAFVEKAKGGGTKPGEVIQ